MVSASVRLQPTAIRWHYDLGSLFYRILWGEHIHHGVWDRDRSVPDAQRALIDRLVTEARLAPGARVLDVGCGLGGTALYLAARYGCDVTGITISPVQRHWAAATARIRGLGRRTRFLAVNAERVSFPDERFDLVLSIECTEHFFDKQRFFRRCAGWLRPNGAVGICAWLAAEDAAQCDERRRLIEHVCDAFLCPSLGSASDYRCWLSAAGLRVESVTLLGPHVARTWEVCMQRTQNRPLRWLARLAGKDFAAFLDGFGAILHAFRSGAMDYGIFVARRIG